MVIFDYVAVILFVKLLVEVILVIGLYYLPLKKISIYFGKVAGKSSDP